MIFSLVLLAATLGGALATYSFDDRSRISFRLAAGACIGQVLLGLVGYALASASGLGRFSVLLATLLVIAVPILVHRDAPRRLWLDLRDGLRRDARGLWEGRPGLRLRAALFLGTVVVLFPLWHRAMYFRPMDPNVPGPDGVFTSYVDNFADLTLHVGIIGGFVHGQNFPPDHPEYAGTRLAYPFLVDFVAAMLVAVDGEAQPADFVRTLHDVLYAQGLVLTVAMVVLLYVWARRLTGSRRAALLVPPLVMMCGGLGFTMLVPELRGATDGAWQYLTHLSHDYSAFENLYRWDNAFVFWFVPMRSMLLGVPLFLIVTGLWWRALGQEMPEMEPPAGARAAATVVMEKDGKKRRLKGTLRAPAAVPKAAPSTPEPAPAFTPMRIMLGAGAVAGLLPLAHAHTFATLAAMGLCFMLITRQWKLWIGCAVVAALVGAPQGLWALSGTSAHAEKFFGWNFGWSGHEKAEKWAPALLEKVPLAKLPEGSAREALGRGLYGACIVWYWLINTGVFIPLSIAALLWRRGGRIVRKPLRLAVLPFLLFCFILPNVVKLAPWDWDNIKVLIYWFIPSVPLVALLLVRVSRWRRFGMPLAATLFVLMTLSGALDLWRVLTGALEWCDFTPEQLETGELIRRVTPPRAVILNATVHNHPFILSGRRSFMGYPGTLWTHGIVYEDREQDLKKIYAGDPAAVELLRARHIDYVVIGPLEKDTVHPLNEGFFDQHFPRAGEAAGTVIYKVG